MKKKAAKTAAKRGQGDGQLMTAINTQMASRVASLANQALVLRNGFVEAYMVKFEQQGSGRAKRGTGLFLRELV